MEFGHSFHFTAVRVPGTLFLDVMGSAAGRFLRDGARRGDRHGRSARTRVPVVSVRDLVELEKTQRIADYDVISNLVARAAAAPDASRPLLAWAARNSFRAEDRAALLARLGRPTDVEECRKRIAAEVARLQARDAACWRRIVADLRRLRRAGPLIPEGTPVSELVA